MINTILFDLDGTLLGMREKEFMDKYFFEISLKFKDISESDILVSNIWDATKQMVLNLEADKLNKDIFFERFNSLVEQEHRSIYYERFEAFYSNEFERVKCATYRTDNMIEAVRIFKEKGYNLVVATNPLFPEMAILKRIEWAGLDKSDFMHITNFERCHFCKPNVEFYKEILSEIRKKPDECMMVGNDTLEDAIAKKLGLTTYIVTDNIIEREKSIPSDYRTGSREFLEFARKMPYINR